MFVRNRPRIPLPFHLSRTRPRMCITLLCPWCLCVLHDAREKLDEGNGNVLEGAPIGVLGKHTHTPKNKKYAVRSLFYPPRSRSPSTLSRFPLHFPSSSPSSFSSSPTPPFLLGSRESRSGTLVCLWLLTFMRVRVVYRG